MSEFVGVQTAKGLQKAAASYGGGPAVNPIAIRVGNGGGAPITPSSAMTDLVHRVGDAYPIIASARDATNPQMWRFRTLIPAAAGPFDIREIGLFDSDGDMLAIAKHVLVEKRTPAQGAAIELETDILVPFAETAQIVVTIAPDALISTNREMRAGWMTVDSATLTAPPANPALGATYLVPVGATGAWGGLAGQIAQWIGSMWVSATMPDGHLIADRSATEDDALRYLKHAAGGAWVSAQATDAAYGPTRIATTAQTRAGASRMLAVCPADLIALTYLRPPGVDYYVDAATGSDTNDGQTAATAFATLDGAVMAITSRYLSAWQVTLHVATGVYGGLTLSQSFVPAWSLLLAAGAVIDATQLAVNGGRGLVANAGITARVTGGLIRSAYEAAAAPGGALTLVDVAVQMSTQAGSPTYAAYAGGNLMLAGAMRVSGVGSCLAAADGGTVQLGYRDAVTTVPLQLQFTPDVTFATAGLVATNAGDMRVAASVVTSSGSPTGPRYQATLNGVINTAGAGANFLPGSAAGVTLTGGQYV